MTEYNMIKYITQAIENDYIILTNDSEQITLLYRETYNTLEIVPFCDYLRDDYYSDLLYRQFTIKKECVPLKAGAERKAEYYYYKVMLTLYEEEERELIFTIKEGAKIRALYDLVEMILQNYYYYNLVMWAQVESLLKEFTEIENVSLIYR